MAFLSGLKSVFALHPASSPFVGLSMIMDPQFMLIRPVILDVEQIKGY